MTSILHRLYDYVLLTFSLLLVAFETIATAFTFLLPRGFIDAISSLLRVVLPANPELELLDADHELADRVKEISDAISTIEMCEILGYQAVEHVVATKDGYILGVHRIIPKEGIKSKGVVYLQHGLLMNSEIWVANVRASDSVALRLVDAGYEVWLGNNRGNKYSKKHTTKNTNSNEFWNFCLDEFAMYDIPATVDYILNVTGEKALTYIGFSQGCTQAFATLSIHPDLNKKIKRFIALAPALAPPYIEPRILQSLMTASPSLLYLLFGRKIILRSVTFWQSIMLPDIYIIMIDLADKLLFKWRSSNISWIQKRTSYPHLYSYTSVKCVVHWFQIIARNSGIFMFDDDTLGFFNASIGLPVNRHSQVPPYPTKSITTPIDIIYGTADTLLNIDTLLDKIPTPEAIHAVEDYEHLEMIWGKKVSGVIIPLIERILEKDPERPAPLQSSNQKERAESVRSNRTSHVEIEDGKLLAFSPPRTADPHVERAEHSLIITDETSGTVASPPIPHLH